MKLLLCFLVLFVITAVHAQAPKFDPPKTVPPDEKTMDLIQHRMTKLREAINALPKDTPEYVRVDVEIYLKALEWAARHNEFFDGGKSALAVGDQGLQRAQEAAEGKPSWLTPQGKVVARAHLSRVDDSMQPYRVHYPSNYGKDKDKKWRLDIVLHGRDSTICETKFLAAHAGKETAKDNDFVQIDIYGRGNNAYRWAGEKDVYDVLFDFIDIEELLGRKLCDPDRFVLRGFSMGGAGTWHLGLHNPSLWSVIGPGAGFTTTKSYTKLPEPLPAYIEPLLHIYDAVDYAENAANVPIVAYSGEIDAQKAAADNIEKRLKELKIDAMTHIVAPGLAHSFPAEWQKQVEQQLVKYAGPGKGRSDYPERVSFKTYTLKYNRCAWLTLLQLNEHYKAAMVEGSFKDDKFVLSTKNVAALRLDLLTTEPAAVRIDGEDLSGKVRRGKSTICRVNGKWQIGDLVDSVLFKTQFVHGPIDDAFTHRFICVKPTGKAQHDPMNQAALSQLERFEKEWDKWMRGKLLVKNDTDVTRADIGTSDLILFGDPSSNSLITEVLPKLPITWTKDQLVVGRQKYESDKYLPMMIYPNPLNPWHYVVLNSGHTFHEAEFKGSNALLFPRLGDYAVVRPMPTAKEPAAFEVMKSGIFDDSWKFAEK